MICCFSPFLYFTWCFNSIILHYLHYIPLVSACFCIMQYHSNQKKTTVDPGCFCDSAAEKLKIWKEGMIKLYKPSYPTKITISIDTLYFPGDFLNLIGFLSETNKLRFFSETCLRFFKMFPHILPMVKLRRKKASMVSFDVQGSPVRQLITSLGGGNSNMFWLNHPGSLGKGNPIWLAHIFFRWVGGSTTN